MKIAWVTRSFLDYRIPVFREFDKLVEGNTHLFFSGDYVPETVTEKVISVLGDRAHALRGERKWGAEDRSFMANRNFSFRWQPGLVKQITDLKPDVMVCDHGFFKWSLPAYICRVKNGTPIVVNYERTHHTERNAQLVRTLYRRVAVRFTDAMNCSGKLCADYSQYLGMPTDRIVKGHQSAEIDFLSKSADNVSVIQEKKIRGKYKVQGTLFLYVGRLEPLKGVAELLRAWAATSYTSQQDSLVLVGDGEQRGELEAFVKKHGLDNVHFAGAVPYDEIAQYYCAADAFIIATLEDNWSLVVPEAMACGLPILSSKYNGCWPEYVQKGKNGWVFDTHNQDDLVACIKDAVNSAGKLAAMGAQSRQIIANHGPKQAAQSILRACEIAIANRS